jgi:hypothetical protein
MKKNITIPTSEAWTNITGLPIRRLLIESEASAHLRDLTGWHLCTRTNLEMPGGANSLFETVLPHIEKTPQPMKRHTRGVHRHALAARQAWRLRALHRGAGPRTLAQAEGSDRLGPISFALKNPALDERNEPRNAATYPHCHYNPQKKNEISGVEESEPEAPEPQKSQGAVTKA